MTPEERAAIYELNQLQDLETLLARRLWHTRKRIQQQANKVRQLRQCQQQLK